MSSRTPSLVIFDVNETLSDMGPVRAGFAHVGLPEHEAATWFASLLRDGFALTVTGVNPSFAELARESLTGMLEGRVGGDPQDAVAQVLAVLDALGVHPDVPDGLRALHTQGLRLVTLSNGATSVAESLLERAGASAHVERLLSVADAPAWKPDRRAYAHALAECGVSDAADALLVAVHPWDVDGAHRAGLRTAWINRGGARYPSYFSAPDLEATPLPHLAELLGGDRGV